MTNSNQQDLNTIIASGSNDQIESLIGGIYYVLYKNQPFNEDMSLDDAKEALTQLLAEARKRGIDETELTKLKTYPESVAAQEQYNISKALYEQLKNNRLARNKKFLLYGGIGIGLILIVANRKKIMTFFKGL